MSTTDHTHLLPGMPFVESPLFGALVEEQGFSDEEVRVARELHERGFAVIDFPDADLFARIDRIKTNLAPRYDVDLTDPDSIKAQGNQRVQDAWQFDQDVREIAANEAVAELLGKLYGRRAFPFQTLNFPVGTQQAPHSDSIHFSSLPERFMCGVWVAFEDVSRDAGPLVYYPGSHRWPVLSNALIGRKGSADDGLSAQGPFESVWQAMADAQSIEPEVFLAKKGQALIWAANLVHGGSPQADSRLTRWSQVTHYYFSDCIYYTPAYSDEALGRLDLRTIRNIATGEVEPNSYLGDPLSPAGAEPGRAGPPRSWLARKLARHFADGSGRTVGGTAGLALSDSEDAEVSVEDKPPVDMPESGRAAHLPDDFDGETYLELYPDVAESGLSAEVHYLAYGHDEGRPYRE